MVLVRGVLLGRKTYANTLKYIKMAVSSNFGNVFSVLIASAWLPFLPMLPTQILLNNFLYDLAQITISTDNVDDAFIRTPQRWNIGIIQQFMVKPNELTTESPFLAKEIAGTRQAYGVARVRATHYPAIVTQSAAGLAKCGCS